MVEEIFLESNFIGREKFKIIEYLFRTHLSYAVVLNTQMTDYARFVPLVCQISQNGLFIIAGFFVLSVIIFQIFDEI